MEILFTLIIFVSVVGGLSIFVDRRLQARQRDAQAPAAAGDAGPEAEAGSSGGLVTELTQRLRALRDVVPFGRQDSIDVDEFRQWLTEAFNTDQVDDQAVRHWLISVPEPGMEAFMQHITSFCTDMNVDLAWLVDGKLDINPELRTATTEVVRHYCRACYQAVLIQPDVYAFEALQAFERHPTAGNNGAFGQKLFARLLDAKLINDDISKHMLSSDQERMQQVIGAIHAAAAKDQQRFTQILRAVVVEMAQPPEPPQPPESTRPQESARPQPHGESNGSTPRTSANGSAPAAKPATAHP